MKKISRAMVGVLAVLALCALVAWGTVELLGEKTALICLMACCMLAVLAWGVTSKPVGDGKKNG